eukprot:gene26106-31524_t
MSVFKIWCLAFTLFSLLCGTVAYAGNGYSGIFAIKSSIRTRQFLILMKTTEHSYAATEQKDRRGRGRRTTFTAEQDAKFLQAMRDCIADNRRVSWSNVAHIVGNKTGPQCQSHWSYFIEYRRSDVADILKEKHIFKSKERRWTPEEEEKLFRALERFQGENGGSFIKWNVISQAVGTRHPDQCRRYWYCVRKNVKSAEIPTILLHTTNTSPYRYFSPEEDAKLLEAVNQFKIKSTSRRNIAWTSVVTAVGSKSKSQCKSRWHYLKATKSIKPQ